MLKKVGLATLALAGMLAFASPKANAAVRFGVGVGVGVVELVEFPVLLVAPVVEPVVPDLVSNVCLVVPSGLVVIELTGAVGINPLIWASPAFPAACSRGLPVFTKFWKYACP